MNVEYFLKYLLRRKWIIVLPTLVATAVAWFFLRNETKTFTSVAEISTGYFDVNPINNRSNPNNSILFNNVIQTLKSNKVLDEVTYSLLLHDLNSTAPFRHTKGNTNINQLLNVFPGGRKGFIEALNNKMTSFKELDLSDKNDRTIRKIADIYGYSSTFILGNMADIRRIDGSDFIDITTTTENPFLSAFISNAICKTFLGFYQNKKSQASETSLDSLKTLVATKKLALENALKLLPGTTDLTNSVSMISDLQTQLTQQKLNLTKAQVALESVNNQINTTSKHGGLANNEDIIALRSNLDNLIAQYTNGGSNSPELADKITRARNQLQQKLSEAGGNPSSNSIGDLLKQKTDLTIQMQVAQKTINDLKNKLNELGRAASSSTSGQSIVQGIQNEIDIARQGYTQANDLLNQALNYTMFPGNNFTQTLTASPPLYPNPSKKIKKIAFVAVGTFFALIFILLFFEFIDASIKAPSYLKANIPLPLLANLKQLGTITAPVEDIFRATAAISEPQKSFREQIKQLRFEVENSEQKSFLITGYHPGSGKSTIAQALAGSFSIKNNRILLVDSNFHNNTISQRYHAGDVLENLELKGNSEVTNKQIIESLTRSGDDELYILGCGIGDHTPDEILPKNNVLAYLKHNNDLFDYVLIDGASLSVGPDSKELLKYVDAVILVYAADQPLTEEDRKLLNFLQKQKVNILGTVLNRINKDNMAI